MHVRQRNRLDALLRMVQFLKQHAAALGDVRYSPARNALIALAARLVQAVEYQCAMRTEASLQRLAIAERQMELRRWHLQPIVAIARARLADDPYVATLRTQKHGSASGRLVAHARGVAKWAAFHTTVFVDEGLPEGFVQQLQCATNTVEQAVAQRARICLEGKIATRALGNHLTNSVHLIPVVDALVSRQLVKKPELLAAWQVAKRQPSRVTRAPSSNAPDPCHRPVGRAGRGRSSHARPVNHPKEAA